MTHRCSPLCVSRLIRHLNYFPSSIQSRRFSNDSEAKKHAVLIDGSPLFWRAFYSYPSRRLVPPHLETNSTEKTGEIEIGGLFGYAIMLHSLLKKLRPTADYIGVFWDSKSKKRCEIHDQYKANRTPVPMDLKVQLKYVDTVTLAFNVSSIRVEGYEADDLIATYCRQATSMNHKVSIISADKDFVQLLKTDDIVLMNPQSEELITRTSAQNKYKIDPNLFTDYQALIGDSTDNIPGALGIGPKRAVELLQQFGSVDNLINNYSLIKSPVIKKIIEDSIDSIILSRQLAILDDNIQEIPPLEALKTTKFEPQQILQLTKEWSFWKLHNQINRESSY